MVYLLLEFVFGWFVWILVWFMVWIGGVNYVCFLVYRFMLFLIKCL